MREYLRELRKRKGLSQQNVADSIGTVQQYYSAIELGERQANMSLSIMDKLAKVFDVSLEYIIEKEREVRGNG